jgi:hypothetical protein
VVLTEKYCIHLYRREKREERREKREERREKREERRSKNDMAPKK